MRYFYPLAFQASAALLASPAPRVMQAAQAAPLLRDAWMQKLAEAEAMSKQGADIETAARTLEAVDEWFTENRPALEADPDYKAGLNRQTLLRVKLARLFASLAHSRAESAVRERNSALLEEPGGAFDRLDRADKLAQALTHFLGPKNAVVNNLRAYIELVRGDVMKKARALKEGGPKK